MTLCILKYKHNIFTFIHQAVTCIVVVVDVRTRCFLSLLQYATVQRDLMTINPARSSTIYEPTDVNWRAERTHVM